MRISDWSSDVCASDRPRRRARCRRDRPDQEGGHLLRPDARHLSAEARRDRPRAQGRRRDAPAHSQIWLRRRECPQSPRDRKSTRLNPVTNAHLVCRLLLEKKKYKITPPLRKYYHQTIQKVT